MSRYANQNPEAWDYMNGGGRKSYWTGTQSAQDHADDLQESLASYRADTIAPTETAGDLTNAIVEAAGARECAVCGTLTFGVAHDQAMCGECQETMAAES